SSSTDPRLPAHALSFQPGPLTTAGWTKIEACSGLTGHLAEVSWYVVPGTWDVRAPGVEPRVPAFWDPVGNRIVIAEHFVNEAWVTRHEMLHALLRRTDHPALYFTSRCGVDLGGPNAPPDPIREPVPTR